MEYRTMEKLGVSVSLLGFGCMRFPTIEGKIDEEKSFAMIDEAIKGGVNYLDTAYPYHNGESETFVGKVLKRHDRSKLFVATKLPCWDVKSIDDAKRIFNEQLNRLGTTYIDFYLLHSLSRNSYNKMKELGVVDYVASLKEEGKIKYYGFSFHDSYSAFEEILKDRQWDFCQIQLNYMDTEEQAGMKGYKLAEEMGVPVVIMEPVKGGSLASIPEAVREPFIKLKPDKSMASWAMRYVGSLPGVKVVLSGMSTINQVLDNLDTFTNLEPLSEEEQKAVEEVTHLMRSRVKNGCTECRYCMPCPAGVNIPRNFRIWNTYGVYENKGHTRWEWRSLNEKEKAKNCIQCGQCEEKCPQGLKIREDLSKLQEELDKLLV